MEVDETRETLLRTFLKCAAPEEPNQMLYLIQPLQKIQMIATQAAAYAEE